MYHTEIQDCIGYYFIGVFAPGQLAVALGRARSSKGLRVVNFQPQRHVLPMHSDVRDFCHKKGTHPADDLSCCRTVPSSHTATSSHSPSDDDDDDDVLQNLLELQRGEYEDESDSIDSDSSDDVYIQDLESQSPSVRVNMKDILDRTPQPDLLQQAPFLQEMVDCLVVKCDHLWPSIKMHKTTTLTQFYQKWHQFTCHELSLMHKEFASCVQYPDFVVFATHVRDEFVSQKSTALKTSYTAQKPVPKITIFNQPNIRYLGGRCVFLASKAVRQYMLTATSKLDSSYENCKEKLQHLDYMRVSLETVKSGRYPGSEAEVERKQNLGGGLTHISDELFDFMLLLDTERQKLNTFEHLKSERGNVCAASYQSLMKNVEIFQKFQAVFVCMLNRKDRAIIGLFKDIVDSYIRITNNEFRQYLRNKMGRTKKLSHRVHILTKSVAQKDKLDVHTVGEFEEQKKEPVVTSKVGKRKGGSSTVGRGKVKKTSTVTQAEVQCKATAGKGKNRGRGNSNRAAKEEQLTICPLCSVVYPGEKDWIGCDSCTSWLCRDCAGLESDEKWAEAEKCDFVCPNCAK